MKKKPIIVMDLSTSGFAKGGGPTTSVEQIMNSKLKQEFEFKTIFYKKELGRGISIKRIKDLTKQIREINPDIVHFSGLQLMGFHIAVACLLAGVKRRIVTVHGFSGDALDLGFLKKIIVSYLLESFTLLVSNRVIAVSDFVHSSKKIKFFASKKSTRIYNIPPKAEVPNTVEKLRKEFNFGNEDILVISVARITKDKGYHILEKAILKSKEIENLKFIIVGDGDYNSIMKKHLNIQIQNQQVHLLGYRNDVASLLKMADIFVLPSLHETLSIALLEASNAGLALIASDTGGLPEILENNHNGLLVTAGSVEELTNAIHKIYYNEILRVKFAKNAKLKIEEKFSSQEIINQLNGVYNDLLRL
jgi:glycosyltransferase involved in cell wall biosynthesis